MASTLTALQAQTGQERLRAAKLQQQQDLVLLADCLWGSCSKAALTRLLQCPRSGLQPIAMAALQPTTCAPDQAAAQPILPCAVPAGSSLAFALASQLCLGLLLTVIAAQASVIAGLMRFTRTAAAAQQGDPQGSCRLAADADAEHGAQEREGGSLHSRPACKDWSVQYNLARLLLGSRLLSACKVQCFGRALELTPLQRVLKDVRAGCSAI